MVAPDLLNVGVELHQGGAENPQHRGGMVRRRHREGKDGVEQGIGAATGLRELHDGCQHGARAVGTVDAGGGGGVPSRSADAGVVGPSWTQQRRSPTASSRWVTVELDIAAPFAFFGFGGVLRLWGGLFSSHSRHGPRLAVTRFLPWPSGPTTSGLSGASAFAFARMYLAVVLVSRLRTDLAPRYEASRSRVGLGSTSRRNAKIRFSAASMRSVLLGDFAVVISPVGVDENVGNTAGTVRRSAFAAHAAMPQFRGTAGGSYGVANRTPTIEAMVVSYVVGARPGIPASTCSPMPNVYSLVASSAPCATDASRVQLLRTDQLKVDCGAGTVCRYDSLPCHLST